MDDSGMLFIVVPVDPKDQELADLLTRIVADQTRNMKEELEKLYYGDEVSDG